MQTIENYIIKDLSDYYGYQIPDLYLDIFATIESYSRKQWPKSGLHNKMKVFVKDLYHAIYFRYLLKLSKSEIVNFINAIYYIRVSTLYNYHLVCCYKSHVEKTERLTTIRKLTSVYLGFVLALCKVKSINPLNIPSVQFMILQYRILFKSNRFSHAGQHDDNIVNKYWFKHEEFGKYIKD